MSILREAGLIESRKEGRWMYHRLPEGDAPWYVLEAIRWVQDFSAQDEQIAEDAIQVNRVCRMDKDRLCACYKKSTAERLEICSHK
jgi:DNA-binding transcriptional ArsR family regulator